VVGKVAWSRFFSESLWFSPANHCFIIFPHSSVAVYWGVWQPW
jgi:hypothetical protein